MSQAVLSDPEIRASSCLSVTVNGVSLDLLSGGALWWPQARLLVISDLHLEKASSYAARGQMLPPYDTRETLKQVERLMKHFQPDTVVSLGDSFHDPQAEQRLDEKDVQSIRRLTAQTDWWWVEGNHDPAPPKQLGGRAARQLDLDGLIFQHEPSDIPRAGEIFGHLHPCAKINGKAGRSVRTRCFATDGVRLAMPSLGALTGGLNVRDEAVVGLFPGGFTTAAIGRDGVYAVSAQHLIPDGAQGSGWKL